MSYKTEASSQLSGEVELLEVNGLFKASKYGSAIGLLLNLEAAR
jgi:hypothetical protein